MEFRRQPVLYFYRLMNQQPGQVSAMPVAAQCVLVILAGTMIT